jgi:hypothetical protein
MNLLKYIFFPSATFFTFSVYGTPAIVVAKLSAWETRMS